MTDTYRAPGRPACREYAVPLYTVQVCVQYVYSRDALLQYTYRDEPRLQYFDRVPVGEGHRKVRKTERGENEDAAVWGCGLVLTVGRWSGVQSCIRTVGVRNRPRATFGH